MDKPNVPIKNEPKKEDTEVTHIGNTVSGMVPAASLASMVKDIVAEVLKAAIPATAIGINQANQMATQQAREALAREIMRKTKRCAICGQPETACGGPWQKDAKGDDIVKLKPDGTMDYNYTLNHTKEYVGPKDDNLFRWFQGVFVNGVRYLSDYYNHKIWIPRKSDILTQTNMWEQNEKDLLQKRQAWGQGAGSIGPQGQVMNRGSSQYVGWR